MANDEIAIKFRSDDSELRATGARLQNFGADIDAGFAKAASGGGITGLFNKVTQLGFGIFGLQQTIQGFGAIAKGIFSGNIEFENFEAEFKILLGSAEAAKARLEELAEFGRTTPFELPEVVRASKTLETFTKGALSTGEGLRLVGDVASGTGVRIDELAMWFGRLYDGLQSGRPVGEAMMRLQELGAISGETRSEIEAMQEAGVDGSVVWERFAADMGRFSGTMEEKSRTMGGAISNISDGIGALKRNLMQGIFDAVKPGVMEFAELLGNKKIQQGAKEIGEALGTGLATAVGFLAQGFKILIPPVVEFGREIVGPAWSKLRDIAADLPGIAKGVYDWAQNHKLLLAIIAPGAAVVLMLIEHWRTLKDLFSQGLSAGGDLLGGALDTIKDFAGNVKWLVENKGSLADIVYGTNKPTIFQQAAFYTAEFIQGLITVKEGLYALEDAWTVAFGALLEGDFSAAWSGFIEGFKQFGEVTGIADEFGAGIKAIGDAFGEANKAIQPALAVWTPLVKDIFESGSKAIGPLRDALAKDLLPALKELAPAGAAIASALVPALEVLGKVLGVALVVAVTAILVGIREFVQLLGTVLPPAITIVSVGIEMIAVGIRAAAIAFETGAKIIGDVINMVVAIIKGDWSKAWEEFKDIFKHGAEGLAKIVELAWETVQKTFTDWVPKLAGVGLDLLKGLWGGFNEGWLGIPGKIQELGMALPGTLGNVTDWLVDVGWDLLRGIAKGIYDGASSIIGAAMSFLGDMVPGWAKKALDILSPSRKMIPIGEMVTAGLAVGIENGAPLLIDTIEDLARTVEGGFLNVFGPALENGTAMTLEAWQGVLVAGLEEGSALSTEAISDLFSDLYEIITNSGMDAAGAKAAQDFVSALVAEFGATGSLANQSLIDFIAGLVKGTVTSVAGGGYSGGATGAIGSSIPNILQYKGGGAYESLPVDPKTGLITEMPGFAWDPALKAWVKPWEVGAYTPGWFGMNGLALKQGLNGGTFRSSQPGFSGGTSSDQVINVTIELDGEKVSEAVYRAESRVLV